MNDYLAYRIKYSNELYHYGVKGQKWGIRRYQNPDGSLTDEGYDRYGVDPNSGEMSSEGKQLYDEDQRKHDRNKKIGLGVGITAAVGAAVLSGVAWWKHKHKKQNVITAKVSDAKPAIVDKGRNKTEEILLLPAPKTSSAAKSIKPRNTKFKGEKSLFGMGANRATGTYSFSNPRGSGANGYNYITGRYRSMKHWDFNDLHVLYHSIFLNKGGSKWII